MKLIGTRKWNRHNRSERINSILAALNCSGQARAEYFKGRSYLAMLFFGRGHPKSVNKDEWNQVKVTYEGKDAFEIFFSRLGSDGRFFDEHFTEAENQHIRNAFTSAEISIQETYMQLIRLMRLLGIPALVVGSLGIIYGFTSGNLTTVVIYLVYTLCFLLILLISSWKRF